MKRYVAGFLFSKDLRHVVLIKKKRPEWQAGKMNAVGGKIEGNEHPATAMSREFREETGMKFTEWSHFCTLGSGSHLWDSAENAGKNDWTVDFFVGQCSYGQIFEIKSPTDETVCVGEVDNHSLYKSTIPNLEWLIPMAKNHLKTGCRHIIAED